MTGQYGSSGGVCKVKKGGYNSEGVNVIAAFEM